LKGALGGDSRVALFSICKDLLFFEFPLSFVFALLG